MMTRLVIVLMLFASSVRGQQHLAVGKDMKTVRAEMDKLKGAQLQPSSNANYYHYKFDSNFILATTCKGEKGVCTVQTIYLMPQFAPMIKQMMQSYATKVNDSLFVKSENDVCYSMSFREGETMLICKIDLLSEKEFEAYVSGRSAISDRK